MVRAVIGTDVDRDGCEMEVEGKEGKGRKGREGREGKEGKGRYEGKRGGVEWSGSRVGGCLDVLSHGVERSRAE